ncbi:SagB family peptide dehydrogenase [Streptomyces spiramyceticus]|uniref:SagB family peptide dehydrogenase n=1 Tax=Streptomyces spiramyceticus TaxID=299717 RepID=UPI00237AF9EC|nr:SagB family peptide dehydrogenase [Streptomyces spiramyceticus]
MPTSDGQATRRYLAAVRDPLAALVDASSAPPRYKHYPDTTRTRLTHSGRHAWKGELLYHLLGLTRLNWQHRNDTEPTAGPGPAIVRVARPVPSGGALYPIEAYLADDTALHHYDTVHHALETLRDGDHRKLLMPAADAEAVLVLTTVFWRSGFKYRDFAYRLQCQEVGALCAQALLLAQTLDMSASVHPDFDGEHTDTLLGLDHEAESTLAVLTFHTGTRTTPGAPPDLDRSAARPAQAPTPVTQLLPHLAALHAAARRPRPLPTTQPPLQEKPPASAGRVLRLPRGNPLDLSQGIARRASPPHGYQAHPITVQDLAHILAAALPDGPATTGMYILARNITGLTPGFYHYDPDQHLLSGTGTGTGQYDLDTGPLTAPTVHALRHAASALIPIGDPLLQARTYGDTGYRLQQAETGMRIHRASLAAAALNLAARIHSDATNAATDAALGLADTPWRSLSFLLIGHPHPSGSALTCRPERKGHRPDRASPNR